MADSLDAPGLASEFEKGTGACEFHTGIDSVLTIEWAGAVVVGYPQDIPEPENAQDHLQLVPTDEELASLTPAECAALED
ncbi:hypothetical protein WS71_20275 [Burkholderia mayonis]|uniref:Uncharacterized protein n=2 Tax=Burkholderia mayonis TaxID=1385591 RepID=A0A1B4G147_9BURK|nr:hypothetical protein WS71_20275 [Burkholderia mayonis]KVE52271.1 hypothetical protein WS71_10100 [Burkholderia mayonis]